MGLESQVQSIALVHGMLYSRGEFTGIDFEDNVRGLKLRVADGRACPQSLIALAADCRGFRIPLEVAVTLGILFNELFLHAVAVAKAWGAISVSIAGERADDGSWNLEHRESYAGLRPGPRAAGLPGMDLTFASLLLRQYEGTIDADEDRLIARLRVRCDPVRPGCS